MDAGAPGRSRLKLVMFVVCAAYWVGIFLLTHLPQTPDLGRLQQYLARIENPDKAAHMAAYTVLGVLMCAAGAARARPTWRLYAVVLATVALYACFDELTQRLVPNRMADFRDWIADMLGAGIGVTSFSVAWEVVKSLGGIEGAGARPEASVK
jgi:VanZ family protein